MADETVKMSCPDCGCYVSDHNAVNRAGDKVIAHCGKCGACWKSTPDFVALVRGDIERGNSSTREGKRE